MKKVSKCREDWLTEYDTEQGNWCRLVCSDIWFSCHLDTFFVMPSNWKSVRGKCLESRRTGSPNWSLGQRRLSVAHQSFRVAETRIPPSQFAVELSACAANIECFCRRYEPANFWSYHFRESPPRTRWLDGIGIRRCRRRCCRAAPIRSTVMSIIIVVVKSESASWWIPESRKPVHRTSDIDPARRRQSLPT